MQRKHVNQTTAKLNWDLIIKEKGKTGGFVKSLIHILQMSPMVSNFNRFCWLIRENYCGKSFSFKSISKDDIIESSQKIAF